MPLGKSEELNSLFSIEPIPVSNDYLLNKGLYIAIAEYELENSEYYYTRYEDTEMLLEFSLSVFYYFWVDKIYYVKSTRKKEPFFSYKDNLLSKLEHIEESLSRLKWIHIKECLSYDVIPF